MIIVWILLIVWGFWLLWPAIRRWLLRSAARKMQQQIFKNMGIDPDAMRQESRRDASQEAGGSRRTRRRTHKIIPDGYGEYVSFTVLALNGTEPWLDTKDSPVYRTYSDTQIIDAQYTIYADSEHRS